jgi:hypothetical protein
LGEGRGRMRRVLGEERGSREVMEEEAGERRR